MLCIVIKWTIPFKCPNSYVFLQVSTQRIQSKITSRPQFQFMYQQGFASGFARVKLKMYPTGNIGNTKIKNILCPNQENCLSVFQVSS